MNILIVRFLFFGRGKVFEEFLASAFWRGGYSLQIFCSTRKLYTHGGYMTQSTVFVNNGTQAVRLPAELRFPENVKKVTVRAVGNERIISPVTHTWDSFFIGFESVSDDFMAEREVQA
ncbi:type II toxin-antitoxin system VapB family antitoxin [Glaciimonas sp. GG7]